MPKVQPPATIQLSEKLDSGDIGQLNQWLLEATNALRLLSRPVDAKFARQAAPTIGSSGSNFILEVNADPVGDEGNLNDASPAAPDGAANVKWQKLNTFISAYYSLDPAFGRLGTIVQFNLNSAPSTQTVYLPNSSGGLSLTANAAYMCSSGYIRNLTVSLATAMPQGSSYQIYIVKNEIPTRVALAISPGDAAGAYVATPEVLNVLAGDMVRLEVLSGGTAGGGQLACAAFEYINDNSAAILGSSSAGTTVAGSTTNYRSLLANGVGSTDTPPDNTTTLPLPFDGIAQKLCIRTNSTQPATGSLVFTVRKNAASTALAVTVDANKVRGTFSDNTNTASFVQGDNITIQQANNAGTASAGLATLLFEYVATGGTNSSIIGGNGAGATVATGSTAYATPSGGLETVQEEGQIVAVRDGQLKNLYANVAFASAVPSVLSWTVTINGIATALAGNVTVTTSTSSDIATYAVNTSDTIDVVKGDLIGITLVGVSATPPPASFGIYGWAMEYAV